MPFNGAGGFAPPAGAPYPAVGGTTILASQFNTVINDLCNQGLANCVTRDGQSPALASLPMGGFKHTNVALAVAATDYARYDQLQSGSAIWCGNATGTANAIIISPAPAITAYAAGQSFLFKATATNNAATTIQISGLASPPAAQNNGAALVGGEIVNGRWYRVTLTSTTTCEVEELAGGTAFTDTLTNKTLGVGTVLTNPANTTQALVDAATITWDASLGASATVTIAGNRTMAAPTSLKVGGKYVLHVTQDGVGGRSLTWNAVFRGYGGQAMSAIQPTLGAGLTSSFLFESPDAINLNLIWSRTGTIQVFSASGTYTPTVGMRWCIARAWGSGGGGGGCPATAAANASAGSGGNSGAYAEAVLTAAQIGASQVVTIGTPGIGVIGANGTAGTATTLGALLSAKGGEGGVVGISATLIVIPPTAPSQSATGDIKGLTQQGQAGIVLSSAIVLSGAGAGSLVGAGGLPLGTFTNGNNATGFAAAGGGSAQGPSGAANTGGNATGGLLVVVEFF